MLRSTTYRKKQRRQCSISVVCQGGLDIFAESTHATLAVGHEAPLSPRHRKSSAGREQGLGLACGLDRAKDAPQQFAMFSATPVFFSCRLTRTGG